MLQRSSVLGIFRISCYADENTASLTLSGHVAEVNVKTIMMAPATGFYTTPDSGVTQVQLACVLCKEDI